MFLLVVPGCLAAVLWVVAVPVETLEHPGVLGSFSRSRELTRGNRWAIFALLAGFSITVGIVGYVFQQIFLGPATNPNYLAAALKPTYLIVTAALGLVTIIITSVGAASIYYELLLIKEGAPRFALANVFD